MDFEEVRKLASRKTRTVYLCLAGEVLDEIDQLQQELEHLPPAASLGDGRKREIRDALAAAQERMRAATVPFKLRAMAPNEYAALFVERPVREKDEPRKEFQRRAFPWYAALVSQTCISPAMTAEQVGELCDLLHFASWNTLAGTSMEVNGDSLDIPNFDAASEPTPSSGPE